ISFVIVYSFFVFDFFFQAEDGIRDRNVTGVQTCALPISSTHIAFCKKQKHIKSFTEIRVFKIDLNNDKKRKDRSKVVVYTKGLRSEERRVGKERRNGGAEEKNKKRKRNKWKGGQN